MNFTAPSDPSISIELYASRRHSGLAAPLLRNQVLSLRPLVKCPPHLFGITRVENDVPKTVGHTVTTINTSRAVMIEVMAPSVAEIRILKPIEVHAVVNPLGNDITLHVAGEHHRQRISRSDKT